MAGHAQMLATKEMRCKVGDGCCSISGQDMTWAAIWRFGAEPPLDALGCRDVADSDLGAGRAVAHKVCLLAMVVLSWRVDEIAKFFADGLVR